MRSAMDPSHRRTSTYSVLAQAAMDCGPQHLRSVLVDVLWRTLWVLGTALLLFLLGFALSSHLASFRWEGPDLGPSDPIILLAALRTFWNAVGTTVVYEGVFAFLGSVGLWFLLEALFRGGRRGFWIYLGTSMARVAFLGGAIAIFGFLSAGDGGIGTLIVGVVFTLSLAFAIALVEAVVRRDAVDLLGTELGALAGLMGILFTIEGLVAFVLWGSVAAAFVSVSGGGQVALALAIGAAAGAFWMVAHSYLIAVRYTAIDIMRQQGVA